MRVRYYTVVGRPQGEVATQISSGAETWLPIVAYASNRHGLRLLSDVGINLLGRRRILKKIEVQVAEPHECDGALIIPVTWRTVDAKVLCPVLDGQIEIAEINGEQTHLALEGTCRPPFGMVGRGVARALLHRLAEATVRDFVERIRERLELAEPGLRLDPIEVAIS